jgi:hypothetical protein
MCFFFAHSGVKHILCCVFVLFDLALCTICCQFLSFIRSWLSLRFPLTEIYFVMYLLFKKAALKTYFLIKDSMSEWRFLGLDPQRWMTASMKDDQCRCSGCPTPSSFLYSVWYCWIIRLYNILNWQHRVHKAKSNKTKT